MDGAQGLLGEGVMGLFSRIGSLFGRDDHDALSIPTMDGVFKPNNRLDTAERILAAADIDNLAVAGGELYFSSGRQLLKLDDDASRIAAEFDSPISMVAGRPDGGLVVATADGCLWLAGDAPSPRKLPFTASGPNAITSGYFEDDDTLVLTIGSSRHAMPDWKRDLMSHGRSGRLVRYRMSTGDIEIMQDGLAFPYGAAPRHDGSIVVAESWRHRLVALNHGKPSKPHVVLGELPAYPARLTPASDGGFWLAFFAPRRQLTELVLDDDDYRLEMMATIAPEHWIGPDFADTNDGEQPLQSGSVRQMGIMKPWAPSRSYGLVARLDRDLRPVESYHSRADGKMHGIASVIEFDGHLYAASRGGGTLLRIPLPGRTTR